MTTENKLYKSIRVFTAIVWLANGLYCKVLDLVPRHRQIVEQILGTEYSSQLTILIGLSEIVMAIWILSAYKTRINAIVQMLIVAVMNVLEFLLVPDLLMWGKMNSIFAFMFISIVGYNEFILKNK